MLRVVHLILLTATLCARRPVLLDCDPGVDDIFALLWLCSRYDAVELVALTLIPGNSASPAQMLTNGVRALSFFDCRDNVSVGLGKRELKESDGFFGEDGLLGLADSLGSLPNSGLPETQEAADLIFRSIERFGSELVLISVGPLTNLAATEKRYPGSLKQVRDVLIMGGSFSQGNVEPHAEFNFWYDAQAAKDVFTGVAHAILFPLDITRTCCFDPAIKDFARKGIRGAWIAEALERATARGIEWREPCFLPHDAYPVGFLLYPSLFKLGRITVDVDAEDLVGRSFLRTGSTPNAWQALSVDLSFLQKYMEDVGEYLTTIEGPHTEL